MAGKKQVTTSQEVSASPKITKNTAFAGKSPKKAAKTAKPAKVLASKGDVTTFKVNKGGRPSAFTEETKTKILTAIGAGNSLSISAQYAAINYETLRLWLKRGEHADEKKDPEFFGFFVAIKKAQADAEALSVGRIRQAAKGGAILERTTVTTERTNKSGVTTTTTRSTERYAPPQWQADAWWLERMNGQQWGRHDRVTRNQFNFDLENLSDEQFELFDQLTNDGVDPAVAYATCLSKKEGA